MSKVIDIHTGQEAKTLQRYMEENHDAVVCLIIEHEDCYTLWSNAPDNREIARVMYRVWHGEMLE